MANYRTSPRTETFISLLRSFLSPLLLVTVPPTLLYPSLFLFSHFPRSYLSNSSFFLLFQYTFGVLLYSFLFFFHSPLSFSLRFLHNFSTVAPIFHHYYPFISFSYTQPPPPPPPTTTPHPTTM